MLKPVIQLLQYFENIFVLISIIMDIYQ